MQVFTSNQLQWKPRTVGLAEAKEFAHEMRANGIEFVCSHASYLVNLASPSSVARRRSIRAFVLEMDRCRRLGIPNLVFHPGAHMGSGIEKGVTRVIDSLNQIASRCSETVCLTVETTAGQGTCLGGSFDQIADIVRGVRARMSICIDTCHLLASGVEFRDESSYGRAFDMIDRTVGLDRIALFHFNDSKGDLGSRVDRHAHIGEGRIGVPTFHRIMDDARFRRIPMILETPEGEAMDPVNLRRLRRRRDRRGR